MKSKTEWDAELYEARHGFVWRMAEGVVELLAPQAGENILDLGCGTGQLTKKIASSGARVTGLDAAPAMIGQARQNYPELTFILQNAAQMSFVNEFDAVFSNAALHWMLDLDAVTSAVSKALKPGGRFVFEMGGKGNVRIIDEAIHNVLTRYIDVLPAPRNYFPALGEYSALLEKHGLEVQFAQLIYRPTPLEGEEGMREWLKQFREYYFEALPAADRAKAMAEVVSVLKPSLYRDGLWQADYRRLRALSVKTFE